MSKPTRQKSTFGLYQKILASAPPDTWLALDCEEGEIIAAGPDMVAVANEAKAQGFASPVMVRSPKVGAAARPQKRRLAA